MHNPWKPFGKEVILELKFTNRFPDWFGDLVRVFKLTQCGAAKYCEGVAAIGEYRLDARLRPEAGLDMDENESSRLALGAGAVTTE